MKIKILEEARQDLVDGAAFYEKQSPGLGEYFRDTLFSDIESLLLYAGIHIEKWGYFRSLSRRFPFAIYYSIESDEIRIQAILDCRRDPKLVEDRLK